jgi:plastocyanin
MKKPGINMTLGMVLLVVSFGVATPILWGASQVVKSDAVEAGPAGPVGGATGGPVTITVVADQMRFDTQQIVVSAGVEVTIIHDNRDVGMPHNLAFFTDSSLSSVIFRSDLVNGPIIDEFTFTAPSTPGQYYFHCDAHPEMNGVFEVQ